MICWAVHFKYALSTPPCHFFVMSNFTQNKVMVNGKGVHVFHQVVLPLLYEMIRECEMEISQLNEQETRK